MSDLSEPLGDAENKPGTGQKRSGRDVAALFTNLHLQHGHYQPFTRRQTAKSHPVPAPSTIAVPAPALAAAVTAGPRGYSRFGIFSPSGGSGKSTLTAAVGSMLCQQGKRVLLVDASPWQTLAFHFGAKEPRSGRRTFFAPGVNKAAVHLISCEEGKEPFADIEQFTSETAVDYILFDLSGQSGERLLTYLRECDSLLVPLLPDPSAIRATVIVQTIMASLPSLAPRIQFILNNMDDSATANEVHNTLTQALGAQLFPSVICNQPEIRQALADGVVLPFYAPEAQATLIVGQLVHWLLAPGLAPAEADGRWLEG